MAKKTEPHSVSSYRSVSDSHEPLASLMKFAYEWFTGSFEMLLNRRKANGTKNELERLLHAETLTDLDQC